MSVPPGRECHGGPNFCLQVPTKFRNKANKMPFLHGNDIILNLEYKRLSSHIDRLIVQISFGWVLIEFLPLPPSFVSVTREAQEFVEKYEGALGKGKGKRLYAYRMQMTKVGCRGCKLWNLGDHHRHLPASPFVSSSPEP